MGLWLNGLRRQSAKLIYAGSSPVMALYQLRCEDNGYFKLLKLNIQVRRLAVTSKICYMEAEVTGSSPVRCTRRYPDSEV
jgi:hypothetical protein